MGDEGGNKTGGAIAGDDYYYGHGHGNGITIMELL